MGADSTEYKVLKEAYELLHIALEEIRDEAKKYREFEVAKLFRKRADAALQDAEVALQREDSDAS